MKPCPKCSSRDIWPEMMTEPPYGMECRSCGFVGPRVSECDPDEAIKAWNEIPRQEAEDDS